MRWQNTPTQQNGQVLLIALIFLVVLSLIGVSAVQTSSSEESMAYLYEDKEFALEAAESALIEAEQWISNITINPLIHAKANCTGDTRCFQENCEQGLCLTGYLDSNDKCILQNQDPWADKKNLSDHYLKDGSDELINTWESEGTYKLVDNKYPGASSKAKYIIEFYCFTQKDPDGVPPLAYPEDRHAWSQLYRITALASGKSENSRVMLQSTLKKD
ncbi:pilus assembly PilX family protein [Marinicellulosiphila megalodicopiae]|uniref:pilus assembly PilX family protein n=1 Tax=Marinicellulosiphila megalodicopiae TaxID=2724896 RepID=UPI003BB1C606